MVEFNPFVLSALIGLVNGLINLALHAFRSRGDLQSDLESELKETADNLKREVAASKTELQGNLNDTKEELEQSITGLVTSERLAQTDQKLDRVIGILGRVLQRSGTEFREAGTELERVSAASHGGSDADSP